MSIKIYMKEPWCQFALDCQCLIKDTGTCICVHKKVGVKQGYYHEQLMHCSLQVRFISWGVHNDVKCGRQSWSIKQQPEDIMLKIYVFKKFHKIYPIMFCISYKILCYYFYRSQMTTQIWKLNQGYYVRLYEGHMAYITAHVGITICEAMNPGAWE